MSRGEQVTEVPGRPTGQAVQGAGGGRRGQSLWRAPGGPVDTRLVQGGQRQACHPGQALVGTAPFSVRPGAEMSQQRVTRYDRTPSHLPQENPPGGREGGDPAKGTHSLTRNGWLTSFSTDFSLCTCCSCFRRMTSGILITFRAKKRVLCFSRTSCTRPNVPVPAVGRRGVSSHGPQDGRPAPRPQGNLEARTAQ